MLVLEKQLGKWNQKTLLAFLSLFSCRVQMLLATDSCTVLLISNVCLLT